MSVRLLSCYACALVVIAMLDALWLGWLARDFYQRELGPLMRPQLQVMPAVLFYLGYPAGLLALALHPTPADLGTAALRSAALGLVAYGAYDMTNMATLAGWTWRLSLVDMAWGACISAASGTAAWLVERKFLA